jgi:hypothetical protein
VRQSEVEAAFDGTDFIPPGHLVSLVGERDDSGGYGHYSWAEIFEDPTDGTYVAVEGGGCSCDGEDAAWAAGTLSEALQYFSQWNAEDLRKALAAKGVVLP